MLPAGIPAAVSGLERHPGREESYTNEPNTWPLVGEDGKFNVIENLLLLEFLFL